MLSFVVRRFPELYFSLLMEITLDPSVVAALIAVVGAVVAYLLGQRQAALERKRKSCAQAIADALQWLELPYRIRRRPDDAAETLSSLGERINNLREQLEFHEKWLRIEIPGSAQRYSRLVKEVRVAAGAAIEDAWRTCPVKSAGDMNIGALDINRDQVEEAVEEFSSAVVKELSWWRVRF